MAEAVLGAFYVYVIFRLNGIPCYIGKGKGYRYKQHLSYTHNKWLERIIKKAKAQGNELPIFIVRDTLSQKEASRIEIALIAEIGRKDKGSGPLVNHTDGGEGTSGWIASEDTRAKMSAMRKGRVISPEHKAAVSRAHAGRPKPASQIAKMRAATMIAMADPARRKLSSDVNKGKTIPEEQRAKIRLARAAQKLIIVPSFSGKTHTAEAKAKIAATKLGKPRSEATKEKLRAAKLGIKLSAAILQARRTKRALARGQPELPFCWGDT